MAENDLLVTISGAALSLLFFENVRSIGDQMGFLLGEALEFVVKTYTDSDNQVETVKIHINVESIVTCPLFDILHNSTGRINKERLKDFVRDKSKHVIGWFRFRRNNNNLLLSLKDKLLHKQFASHFSSGNGCKEELFLTCLLNASVSETRGTHKFRHVFLRRKRGMFESISLKINNLGDDASRHDGSDYKSISAKKSTHTPDGFIELVESLNLDLTKTGGADSAMMIQRAAERHLISLIPKVCESDLEVAELERQVHELRAKVMAQRQIKKLKINGENYTKEARKNTLSTEIEPSWKKETNRISDDKRTQKDHTTFYTQPIFSQRVPYRNTAACIAKSVNQERPRQLGFSADGCQSVQGQLLFANTDIISTAGSHRRPGSIPEIVTEPICSEDSETSCLGRGRGNGGRTHEFNSGMRKMRRAPASTAHLSREHNISPGQDYSDAPRSPQSSIVPSSSPPTSRLYNQAAKKNRDDSRNSMGSLDI